MPCRKRDEIERNRVVKELNRKIDYLRKKGKVDPEEFRGFDRNTVDEEDAGTYNRDIIRDEYETTMELPYSRIELYADPTFGYKDSGIR